MTHSAAPSLQVMRHLASTLSMSPGDPQKWMALARFLLPSHPEIAFSLIEESPLHGLGREKARALRSELGGVEVKYSGRSFAPRHIGDVLKVSPQREQVLLQRADRRLSVFAPSQHRPTHTLPNAITSDWSSDERILLTQGGAGFELRGLDGALVSQISAPGPIKVILGGGEGHAVIEVSLKGKRDIFSCALEQDHCTPLPNTDLDLKQALSWRRGIACSNGGLQSGEVRFISLADGSWRARMDHPNPLRALMAVGKGEIVSLDRMGHTLRWTGDRPQPRYLGQVQGLNLTPKLIGAAYDAGGSQMLLCLPAENSSAAALNIHPLKGGNVWKMQGLSSPLCVLDSPPRVAVVGDTQGWYWLDLETRKLPAAWRFPTALATLEELSALPLLSQREENSLSRWRQTPFRGFPSIEHEGLLSARVSCPMVPVLKTLLSGSIPVISPASV